jgi:AraC-like DNA-binding protein
MGLTMNASSLSQAKNARKGGAGWRAQQSFILHEKGHHEYYWQGEGWLSIKSFHCGKAFYNAGQGHFAVDDQHYLVLNHGQPYSITIESETPVESFCVFLQPGLAEDIHRNLISRQSALLDDTGDEPHPINFFEKTYRHDDILTPALFGLRRSLALMKKEPGWLDEQLHELVQRLLRVNVLVHREAESLAASRMSTREELYRRLWRARDYMEARLDQRVLLDDVARVACLSPNHLIRTFRQAFGQSPHQYLMSRRLERAATLLTSSDRPVIDVCYSVGFESPGSFSWLFRKRYGVSPARYRLRKK